ncbi:rhodanese/Cell cycle control phosphatasesuperfamily protein [Striga asiatica]|uniref:Rhodanese/Cell cycle control phosphatasesuperfamily protein n=1 Tax=Striga asiatica TaxID=4170 RepID=A0A5A7R0P3_STRAF|nr:rhodanese/Cell cycle control phosphatasesuperfamily protein [Striga asiatica]
MIQCPNPHTSSMHPRHPLLLYRRTASSVAALRMLSSSTASPNPNPSIAAIVGTSMTKPTSEIPSKHPLSGDSLDARFSYRGLVQANSLGTASKPITIGQYAPDAETVEPLLVVVSFYKFADFPDHAELRKPLKELCEQLRVSGGIILAPEGINGSICGTRDSVEEVLSFIQSDERLKGLRRIETPVSPEEEAIHLGHTSSTPLAAGEDAPFRWDHVRVKLKKEVDLLYGEMVWNMSRSCSFLERGLQIVTLGMPSVSPIERVGTYVSPKEWNELISDPDTVVIDVRNDYETRIGKFKRAVDPCTTAFRDFPSWVDKRFKLNESGNDKVKPAGSAQITGQQVEETEKKMPRIAMYCTGGIRCEKASSFLLSKGFKEVYHLQGGILKYLEEVPKTESLWEGECFVFDKRVSVEHGLVQGTHKLCYGCKKPVSDADMESPEWEYAVSCPYCYSSKSEEEKERARARQRQFETCGIIGGPDKGRKPNKTGGKNEKS